jgi:hypothetical protein
MSEVFSLLLTFLREAWIALAGAFLAFALLAGIAHMLRVSSASALKFCRETGVRLVYAQISPKWVQELVGMALGPLLPEVTVVMTSSRRFGKMPNVAWGMITAT